MSDSAPETTIDALSSRWLRPATTVLVPARAAARRRQIRAKQRVVMLDLAMLAISSGLIAIEASVGLLGEGSYPWIFAFPLVALLMLNLKRMHRPRILGSLLDDARGILASTAMAAMAVTFFSVLFKNDPEVGESAIAAWLTGSLLLVGGRSGLRAAEVASWRRGGGQPTLVVGAGRIGHLIAERLAGASGGLRPVAFLDDEPLPGMPSDLPVLPTDQLERYVAGVGVEHAILAFSNTTNEAQLELVERFGELGVAVSVVPRLFEGVRDEMTLERIGGLPLVSMHGTAPASWRFGLKYALDRCIAGLILLAISPLFILLAIAVAVDLGNPIFFRQTRIGIDGIPFEMLKFRSMREAASPHQSSEHSWKSLEGAFAEGLGPGGVEGEGDRRTRLGALIRRTSIDELPQLVNVFKGEMSIVGPRPERPPIVERFEQQFHRYSDRHRVKPGITGWAQVHGLRGRTSISDRVEWDNYYVENWSPWLDLKVVTLTVLALVRDDAE